MASLLSQSFSSDVHPLPWQCPFRQFGPEQEILVQSRPVHTPVLVLHSGPIHPMEIHWSPKQEPAPLQSAPSHPIVRQSSPVQDPPRPQSSPMQPVSSHLGPIQTPLTQSAPLHPFLTQSGPVHSLFSQSEPEHPEWLGGFGSSGSAQFLLLCGSSQFKHGESQYEVHFFPQLAVQVGPGGPPWVNVTVGVGIYLGREVVDQGQGGGKKVRSSVTVCVANVPLDMLSGLPLSR